MKSKLLFILATIFKGLVGFGVGGGLAFMISTYLICEWSCEMGIIQAGIISLPIGVLIGIITSGVFSNRSNMVSPSVTKSSDEESTEYLSKESFSKLTYRQRFAVTEYGYLLSPENAEIVGKMLGNFHEKDVLPFCQANGKRISGVEK